MSHDGLSMGLGTIARLCDARTRSITAENVYGEKGRGGMAEVSDQPQRDVVRIGQRWERCEWATDMGRRWKVRPCITIPARSVVTIMDVDGPGVIQHMWFTLSKTHYRDIILRIYWDGETEPSVEAPIGDFFCNGFRERANVMSMPINVNPSGGFNCYFPMPFRKHARITAENRFACDVSGFFYAINYAMTDVDEREAYFHAQFRRMNPVPPAQDYVIVDGVRGRGHYVGCYLAWKQSRNHWWGEGEVKMYLDGDREFPTICGTGTEDYFGGAWGFGQTFSAPFLGYPYCSWDFARGGDTPAGTKHGLYRFHIMDPVRFQSDLKVDIQALGWKNRFRYAHLEDDIASVGYWYQAEPHTAFPAIPDPIATDDADLN
ncbi:MAG: DUF2961 domain-containing protein [Kiritimatiellae bacterium]|nr:DUF2961 domain-containing protein [Kiritimatiellia bacterium]